MLCIFVILRRGSDASHLRPLANILYGRKHFRINYYRKSVIFLLLPSYINGWYRGVFIGGSIFTITFSLYSDTKTWGSLWCWFSNIIGLFLIIYVFEKDLCIKKHWISSLRNMFPANFSLDFVR